MELSPVTFLRLVPASPMDAQDATPMSVRTYRSNNWFVVEVDGEIDVVSAPALRPLVEEQPFVVLDLRRVSFVDCSGLRLLGDGARAAAGGRLRVAGASGWLRRLVGLMPFEEPVSMFDSVEEALSTPTTTPRTTTGRDGA